MMIKKEIKKWLQTLNNHYDGSTGEEQLRLEIQIETLQKVLGVDKGTFEYVSNLWHCEKKNE